MQHEQEISRRLMEGRRTAAVEMFVSVGLLFMLLHESLAVPAYAAHNSTSSPLAPFTRANFPKGFIFGVGSAAYQYEGAAFEDGKGLSIWDTFTHQYSDAIADGSNGDVADDQYHRYKEDIELLHDLGVDSYRFSISWPRILPDGKGKINRRGVDYYNKLINKLLERGIQPFVTMYHWDLPQALQDAYGGWLNQTIIKDFANFAEICFREFGDRVKHWTTFNEPNIFTVFGYNNGTLAPHRCSKYIGNCTGGDSATEPYIVAHNVLLSHAEAVSIYRRKYQKLQGGSIGIVVNLFWYIALDNNLTDTKAVQRALDFFFGWFVDPIIVGDYPSSMQKTVGDRLPSFSTADKKKLKLSVDFIGINYYTTQYVSSARLSSNINNKDFYSDQNVLTTDFRDGISIGSPEGSPIFEVVPKGIYDAVSYVTKKYNKIPIYITENGYCDFNNKTLTLKEFLNDTTRIKFHKDHLSYLAKAIRDGAIVRGYFAWTFLDDFEWNSGYTLRFGLYYVNFTTLHRYAKASAKWFKASLSTN